MSKRVFLSDLQPLILEQLQNGGEIILTITGNSMAPMLYHRRDKVCIVKPTSHCLKKYDLPLFKRVDGKFIIHRIISVKNHGYTIMGDNQVTKEYSVTHSQILGVVKGFWRKDKYISCSNPLYKVYCRVWYFAYPFRFMYIKGKIFFGKVFNALGETHDKG